MIIKHNYKQNNFKIVTAYISAITYYVHVYELHIVQIL